MTLNRPMLGMSIGGVSVLAPSSPALRVDWSTSFTWTYSSQHGCGGAFGGVFITPARCLSPFFKIRCAIGPMSCSSTV